MISAENIVANYETHEKIINNFITDRKDAVLKMLEDLGERYVMAPASGKSWYHNAFPGGYVDHVNRVVKYALKQKELYADMEGEIDFTDEELVFSALFHDLGKIGDPTMENYIKQNDKWRQDKLHEMYTNNPDLQFMLIPDRSLFLLQHYGVRVSQKEYLAIRTHDGVFDDANKAYFFSHNPNSRMKTSIVNILHSADFLASKVEYDIWKRKGGTTDAKTSKVKSNTGQRVNASPGLTNMLKNL